MSTAVDTRAHRFWNEDLAPTSTRDLPSTFRDDDAFLDIEVPASDEMVDGVFGFPPAVSRVLNVTVDRDGAPWAGIFDQVSLMKDEAGTTVFVLTYRSTTVETDVQKLLEVLS
ncbi:hypothetical protein [Rhodococcus zopfii]|uniref:hypothetical protein n=1 Tax=Rhodococcus zopfii TaxID=43772 RepID=UPI003526D2E9